MIERRSCCALQKMSGAQSAAPKSAALEPVGNHFANLLLCNKVLNVMIHELCSVLFETKITLTKLLKSAVLNQKNSHLMWMDQK